MQVGRGTSELPARKNKQGGSRSRSFNVTRTRSVRLKHLGLVFSMKLKHKTYSWSYFQTDHRNASPVIAGTS